MNNKLKQFTGIIFILFAFLAFIFSEFNQKENLIRKHFNILYQIEKPLDDDSDYEIFTTQNGIKTLLISVSETQYVGASIILRGVGSFQDNSTSYPGMSHFVEHLLFMASKKHNVSHFDPKATLENGIYNGLTGNNITIYPFAFEEASILYETMNKIVQFIIDPVFSNYILEREMHAVGGEYYLDLIDGNNKIQNLYKILCNKNHPYSIFDVGNVKSLKGLINNSQIVQQFVKQYYVPDNMFLVIYADKKQSQKVKRDLTDIFEQLPRRKPFDYPPYQQVFEKSQLSKFIKLQDSSKVKQLSIKFNINCTLNQETSLKYFMNVISSMKNDYCTNLQNSFKTAQCSYTQLRIDDNVVLVGVDLILTKKGYKYIVDYIRDYLIAVKSVLANGIQQNFFNVFEQQQNQYFEIIQREDVQSELINIGTKFSKCPNKYVLKCKDLWLNFNAIQIKNIISQINSQNSIIVYRADEFEQIEQQYSPELKGLENFIHPKQIQNFTRNDLYDINYNVYDLSPNLFESFEIIPEQENYDNIKLKIQDLQLQKVDNFHRMYKNKNPQLIHSTYKSNLWFVQDDSFILKFSGVYCLMQIPQASDSAKNFLFAQLISNYYNYKIQETVSAYTNQGISFGLTSFSNKIIQKIQKLAKKINRIDLTNKEELIYILEVYQITIYQNLEKNPFNQAMSQFLSILLNKSQYKSFTIQQIQDEINQFDFSELKEWFIQYKHNFFLQILVAGDLPESDAICLQKSVEDILDFEPISQNKFSKAKVLSLELNQNNQSSSILRIFSNTYDHYNHVTVNIYQIGYNHNESQIQSQIYLNQMFQAWSFNFLRQQSQLGYVAGADIITEFNITFLIVYVEGYRFDTQMLDFYIEELFTFIENKILQLKDNITFPQYLQPLKQQFLNLNDEIDVDWKNIISDQYFNHKSIKIHHYLSKKNLIYYYRQWFKITKQKLSIQIVNQYKNKVISNETLMANQTYNGVQSLFFDNVTNLLAQDYKYLEIDQLPILENSRQNINIQNNCSKNIE